MQTVTLLAVLAAACGGSSERLQPAVAGHAGGAGKSASTTTAGHAADGGKPATPDHDAAAPVEPADAGSAPDEDAAAPTAGSAASAGTGGSPAGAGTGGRASDAAVDPPLDRGPYFTSGQWHGYFWVAQHAPGTTLTTSSNFTRAEFESPLCIQGSVAATTDNTGNAMLGVNLNQVSSGEQAVQTVAPSLDGVTVQVKNNAGGPLRLQIQALDGDTNDQARWCAVLTGSGGFIPWSQFNTACWDGSGKAYQRQPISGAMLLVPGASAAVRFDVCLEKLAEASSPPPGG